MATLGTCDRCGGPLTVGQCLHCESQSQDRFVHREIVILAVLVGVTIAAFFVTRRFAASNQALRLKDARAWYARGAQALQEGDAEAALAALRRATAKDPDAHTYRLALASALITALQDEAARQVLVGLREQQPEDAETNLQLARLETRGGDRAAVGRYYQTAIVGLWRADQRPAQRQVRTEFIEFLLANGERDRALSELLVLETSLPADMPSQLAAGRCSPQAMRVARVIISRRRLVWIRRTAWHWRVRANRRSRWATIRALGDCSTGSNLRQNTPESSTR